MGENTKIQWCDFTFNAWMGCDKVGPGCDHCYAEAWAKRTGMVGWGPKAPRRRTSNAYWRQPIKWQMAAEAAGRLDRVFCNSLADVFDNKAPDEWRQDLFHLIKRTPNLFWMLLTKRIGNAAGMLPPDWGDHGYPNVMIMATVVNQEEADRDIPKLQAVPARWRGLSMEPLLGPVNLIWDQQGLPRNWYGLHLIICGGESGPAARDFQIDWARSLQAQCQVARRAFFLKQLGRRPMCGETRWELHHDKHHGGDMADFPIDLRTRDFPRIEA